MFEDIHRDLLVPYFRNPSITPDMWRRIFTTPWKRIEKHTGFALMDANRIVGYIGTVFATVAIDGRPEKFCNITAWVVDRDYRHQSLRVFFSIGALKDYTMTAFTPVPTAARGYKSIGFRVLDSSQIVGIHSSRSPMAPLADKGGNAMLLRTIADPVEIRALLNPHDTKVFDDHRPCPSKNLLFAADDGSYCYVMFNVVRRKIPLSDLLTTLDKISFRVSEKLGRDPHRVNQVLYVSDPDMFARRFRHIVRGMFSETRVRTTVVDKRLVGLRPIDGTEKPLLPPKLYWSASLKPEKIQNHYSELALLNL